MVKCPPLVCFCSEINDFNQLLSVSVWNARAWFCAVLYALLNTKSNMRYDSWLNRFILLFRKPNNYETYIHWNSFFICNRNRKYTEYLYNMFVLFCFVYKLKLFSVYREIYNNYVYTESIHILHAGFMWYFIQYVYVWVIRNI